MQHTPNHIFFFFLIIALLTCNGCSSVPSDDLSLEQHLVQEETDSIALDEQSDEACSYFYFLWGTHAENNSRYEEAEEAYEKALICDPDSRSIIRKLPILLMRMNRYEDAAKWLNATIAKYPNDSEDRTLLARLHVRNDEIDKAVKLYKELIAIDPDDETVLLRLGFLYSEQKLYANAEKIFHQALALNNESLFAHLYLARLAVQNKKKEQAEQWYEKAIALNWSVDLALELAQFYTMQNNLAKVEDLYRSILEKHPNDRRGGLGLVHTLLLRDKEQEAFDVLMKLRKDSGDTIQIDIILARLHLRSNRLDKAASILTPLAEQGDVPEATYMLSVIYYEQKKFSASLSLLSEIIEGSSHYEESIYLQIRILMEQHKQSEAIEIIQKIIANEAIATPGFYTLLASLYIEQDKIQDGYDILETALVKYPDNAQIYFEYALLLEQDDQQNEAIIRMEKILEIDPDHAEALNYLGYTWADNNINLDKALQYIQKSMSLKPDNGYIQDSLGWVYFRMGKLDLAIKEIVSALKLAPDDPHIHEHLGEIYLKMGKKIKGREAFTKAKQLFKTPEDKLRLQEKIDALK